MKFLKKNNSKFLRKHKWRVSKKLQLMLKNLYLLYNWESFFYLFRAVFSLSVTFFRIDFLTGLKDRNTIDSFRSNSLNCQFNQTFAIFDFLLHCNTILSPINSYTFLSLSKNIDCWSSFDNYMYMQCEI